MNKDIYNMVRCPYRHHYIVIKTKRDTKMKCLVTYTFVCAVTDEISINVPAGTELFADVYEDENIISCNVISDFQKVFNNIEELLKVRFSEFYEDYTTLCSSFCIYTTENKLPEFDIREATDEDLYKVWKL